MAAFLDHASSSPLRPEVIATLHEVLELPQVDPGRPYDDAITVRRLIEDSRKAVADLAHVTARQVVFTSSIAESALTALRWLSNRHEIATSMTERTSIVASAQMLGTHLEIPVDRAGHLDLEALRALLTLNAVDVVSIHMANHETGTLQDIEAVISLVRKTKTALHIDASMAFGRIDVDYGAIDADAVSVAGELLGAPLGTSALIVRKGSVMTPLFVGGSQERARRAGLENILGIVGMGVAASVLAEPGIIEKESLQAQSQIALIEQAALKVAGVEAVGDNNSSKRVANVRCFSVAGVEAEPILMGLNRAGIAVHSGSACSSETFEPSPVLAAMGLEADRSMRVSVGWSTTDDDAQRFATHIGPVIEQLRSLGHD